MRVFNFTILLDLWKLNARKIQVFYSSLRGYWAIHYSTYEWMVPEIQICLFVTINLSSY